MLQPILSAIDGGENAQDVRNARRLVTGEAKTNQSPQLGSHDSIQNCTVGNIFASLSARTALKTIRCRFT
jgi:hypothetical protein